MMDKHAKYRDEIRQRGQMATPYRIGKAVGMAGEKLPSPYQAGSRGDVFYHQGVQYGLEMRRAAASIGKQCDKEGREG